MQRYKQSGKIWQDRGRNELWEEISERKIKLSQEKGHAEVAKKKEKKIRQLLKAFLTGVKKQAEWKLTEFKRVKVKKSNILYIIVVPPEKRQNNKTEIKVIIKKCKKTFEK